MTTEGDPPRTDASPASGAAPAAGLKTDVAVGLAVLTVLAAVGIGLGASAVFRPAPTPIRVVASPTPIPTPVPYDEATLFRQPISGGCSTSSGVWLVTNGGGLLRYDGQEWALVDPTLRSLTRAACSSDVAYGIGLLGALVIGDETTRQIRAIDITIEDLWGIAPMTNGALIVGARGAAFLLDRGDVVPVARGIQSDLFDVVAFNVQSAWAVGDRGVTYRLDSRGWSAVDSGQTRALRAVAASTPANALAVGDAGTILAYSAGWSPWHSGVDVTLRDVIVEPAVFVAGDRGTLLTPSRGSGPAEPLRKIDLGTTCDLVSVFARAGDVWVVGRGAVGGAVWRMDADGRVLQRFGSC